MSCIEVNSCSFSPSTLSITENNQYCLFSNVITSVKSINFTVIRNGLEETFS